MPIEAIYSRYSMHLPFDKVNCTDMSSQHFRQSEHPKPISIMAQSYIDIAIEIMGNATYMYMAQKKLKIGINVVKTRNY